MSSYTIVRDERKVRLGAIRAHLVPQVEPPATPVWRQQAACGDHPSAWWFADGERYGDDDVRRALAVCAECPVRLVCLEHAMHEGEPHGIWGGLTAAERRALHRRRRRQIGA